MDEEYQSGLEEKIMQVEGIYMYSLWKVYATEDQIKMGYSSQNDSTSYFGLQ